MRPLPLLSILLMSLALRNVVKAGEEIEMKKSAPVEVNGLEFMAATQARWVAKKGGSQLPIEIQLWIANKSDHDVIFRTFDTFSLKIADSDGVVLPAGGGREGTMLSPPVLIRREDTYCLARKAELWWKLIGYSSDELKHLAPVAAHGWKPDGKACDLFYWDETGSEFIYQLAKPGFFHLFFVVENSEKQGEKENHKLGGLPVWVGNAETKPVQFEAMEE